MMLCYVVHRVFSQPVTSTYRLPV